MGTVYLAMHLRLEKTVALKILKADRKRDSTSIARFEREMKSVGKLEHPHIVRALDAGDEGGTYFLVMEFLQGWDLGRLLKTKGRLEVPLACELIHQAALGLQHAHDHNLVHRDVKPSNLMLSATGQVKVLDLGLAQLQVKPEDSDEMTRAGEIVGTWRYMAPEQVFAGRQVDARSDIFSLGVTLYNLLVGELPLRFGQSAIHLPPIATLRSDVPPDLQALLGKMLAPSPPDRIQKMSEVAGALQAYQTQGACYIAAIQSSLNQPPPLSSTTSDATQSYASMAYETKTIPPVFQFPPPLQNARTATLSTTSAPIPSRWRWQNLTTVTKAVAITTVSAALAIFALVLFGNQAPVVPPPDDTIPVRTVTKGEDPPVTTGTVTLAVDNPDADLPVIFAIPKDGKQEKILLTRGDNQLLPGSYYFISDHPDRLIEPEVVSVQLGIARTIKVNSLPHVAWLIPRLPDQAGGYIQATGTLWKKGMFDEKGKRWHLPYDLQLTMGEKQNVFDDNGKEVACQWLDVLVTTKGLAGEYTETGRLLIDTDAYSQQHRLIVKRGWVTGGSKSIAKRLEYLSDKALPPLKLAVEFNESKDALAETAIKLAMKLPQERISVQHALNLLFGSGFESDSPLVQGVRSLLAKDSERKASREIVTGGPNGDLYCWTVKSDPTFKPAEEREGYCFYRHEGVPFSLVQIDVILKDFQAGFKLTKYGSNGKVPQGIKQIETLVAETKELKRPWVRFDEATLPEKLGAAATYHVKVKRGSLPEKVFTVSLRMADERKPNEPSRLLEVVVTDGDEFTEEAQLQVLDQREIGGAFVVQQGWIRQQEGKIRNQGEIFPFDPTGDRESFQSGLLKLGKQPIASVLTIHDVLTLLFDAKLADPRARDISKLRGLVATKLKDAGLAATMSFKDDLQLFANESLTGEEWTVPELEGLTLSYNISRSRKLPFDFSSVVFKMQNLFELTATLKHRQVAGAPSPLGVVAPEVANQRSLTDSRVKAAEKDENWRVWKWKQADKPRLWAEFRGKLEIDNGVSLVLLKTVSGGSVLLPLLDFSDEDIDWIEGGRKWLDKNSNYFPQRSNFLSKPGSMVKLKNKDGKTGFVPIDDFFKSEIDLIEDLNKRLLQEQKAIKERKQSEKNKAIRELQNKPQGSK